MPLHIHRSHRTEVLAEALGRVLLGDPLADPMQAERLMVGSRGMGRWLATHLVHASADEGGPGVVANVEVDLPVRFVERLVDDVIGARPPGVVDPWSADALVWTLAGRLPDAIEQHPAPFAEITRYLGVEVTTAVLTAAEEPAGEVDVPTQLALEVSLDTSAAGLVVDRRLLGLATTTAQLFDRYALFRPAMVRAWREGDLVDAEGSPLGAQAWQALLWQAVAAQQAAADSPADRIAAARLALDEGHELSEDVPPRLFGFGISTLPPLHLELLAAVARQRAVHLFVPSPAPALWRVGWTDDDDHGPTDPLLRASGAVARDAAVLLAAAAADAGLQPRDGDGDCDHEHGPDVVVDLLLDGPPVGSTVLARLQQAMADDAPAAAPPHLAPDDRSVVFHDGHGAVRQVEALKDELLRRFAADETLQPRDVVVLTPDTATFGPLVEAVFADPLGRWLDGHARDGEPPTIPVAVTDRAGGGNPVAAVLRRVLALVHARTSPAEVLDLLSTEAVRARFRLTPTELLTVTRWIEDTGVAWARDERDRGAFEQPPRRAHTWAAARDRLLLGVALSDEGQRDVGGVVPYDHVEDQNDLDLLDRLTRFLDVVDDLAGLRTPRGTGAWAEDLSALLDRLTGPASGLPWLERREQDLHQRHRGRVDRVLGGLGRLDEAVARDVDVRALARWLDVALTAAGGAAGHATGAVTVAELVPLRAIPYRVVCLLGMDTDRFPRGSTPPGHDLMARDPRPGDRDRRADDRALFLDAVHAARDALVVTWAGRDPITGRDQPPAVPVTELREAVEAHVGEEGLDRLTTVHGVLPTGPAAFTPGAPASFDDVRRAAAEAGRRARSGTPPFVAATLPPDEDAEDEPVVPLDLLTRRLAKPAQALLDRLRIARPEDLHTFPETEPLELDALQRWQLGTALLDASTGADGTDVDRVVEAALARGPLPAGAVGRFVVRDVHEVVARMHTLLDRLGETREERPVAATVGEVRVEGSVTVAVGDRTQVVETWYGQPDGKRHLRTWLRHLVVCADDGLAGVRTVVLHREKQDVTASVHPTMAPDTALRELAAWLDWYERCRDERMPFVAKVSWIYASARREAECLAADTDGVSLADVEGLEDAELVATHGASGAGRRTVASVLDGGLDAAHRAWGRGEDDRSFPARMDDDVAVVFRDLQRWEDLVAGTDLLPLARRLLRPVVDSLRLGEVEAAEVCA